MESELPAQLLAEARRQTPTRVEVSRLMPYREALLTFRAKRISYERIATILKGHNVTIAASTIGYFCRRHCPEADIERVRRSLVFAAIGAENVALPPVPALPSAPPPTDPGKRRNPRIARDDL